MGLVEQVICKMCMADCKTEDLVKKDMIFKCCVFFCMLLIHLCVWCHDRLHLYPLATH